MIISYLKKEFNSFIEETSDLFTGMSRKEIIKGIATTGLFVTLLVVCMVLVMGVRP